MAQTTVAINLEAKTKGTESVKSLKAQIKEATNDAIALSQKFGEFSPQAIEAAQKVAKLKDEMQDFQQRVAALNPDKFDAIGKVVGGVASGFSAAQGAMALFGSESEDLQKTLLKVQGAMAMAQGIQGVLDARKQFVALGSTAINAFKGMTAASKAFMLTGIGLVITAIGALISYWDDIKVAINGVSSEQKKLNEESKKGLETEKSKSESLEKSENTLKLQGKSERQIRDLKIQQYNAELAKAQAVLKNAKITKDLEVAAAKRNRETTIGIIKGGLDIASFGLKALALPIDALINTANKVSEILGFGQITTLQVSEQIDKMNKSISETVGTWLFDPAQVAKDGDATIKAAESTVQDLISKRDGLILAGREADKKAAEDAKVSAENARQQALENAAKMAALNQKTLDEQIAAADAAFKVNEAQLRKNGLTEIQIGALRDAELEKVRTAYYEKKAVDDKKALDEAIAKTQKETDEIYKLREKGLVDRKASDEEFNALELERLNAQLENAKKYGQSTVDLELQIAQKKKAIYDKDAENKKLAEEAKKDFQEKTLQATYDSLAALQGILKEGSDAAKAAALLDIAIKTGVGFAQGLDIAQKGAAGTGPAAPYAFPIFYAQQIAAVLGAVSRAKAILKGGSGGGGSTGGGGVSVPSAPALTPTAGGTLPDEQQFGGMGRVYVLEGDITKTQTRVRRLRNTSVV